MLINRTTMHLLRSSANSQRQDSAPISQDESRVKYLEQLEDGLTCMYEMENLSEMRTFNHKFSNKVINEKVIVGRLNGSGFMEQYHSFADSLNNDDYSEALNHLIRAKKSLDSILTAYRN